MAGIVIERQLRAVAGPRLQFAVAAREDDAVIRRLLRENPTAGAISLSFEREPDYFADTVNPFEVKQTIVAHDDEKLVCMGSCSVRSRFINGKETRVGYLGGLRLAAGHAGHTQILRAGYEFFHRLQSESPADFYFTSIASDNHRARRILERGLPGMPIYEFIGELVTLMIPEKRSPRWAPEQKFSRTDLQYLSNRLNRFNRDYQLAPVWTAGELEILSGLGLQPHNFYESGGASAALWDQAVFKQIVVRGYSPMLARMRFAANALSAVIGGIRLPAVGNRIRHAFVSHLVTGANEKDLVELLNQLRAAAGSSRLESLVLTFAADDARLKIVRQCFRAREYHSRIYVVHWPDCGNTAGDLNHHLIAPEAALL